MAGKRGDKRKQPTKTSDGRRSSPRKSTSKSKTSDISDLSDGEHLQNEDITHKQEKQKKSTKRTLSIKKAPSIQSDQVEFALSNVAAHLMCQLCGGYYRECHTLTDCLHSFCRSCLILFFDKKKLDTSKNETPRLSCPTCDNEIGPHPFRKLTSISTVQILPDRTLQEVVDKVFPRFKVRELEDEKKFYAERNIKLKAEYQMLENIDKSNGRVQESMKSSFAGAGGTKSSFTSPISTTTMVTAATAFMNDDNIIELRLQPADELPLLQQNNLKTSGKLKIVSLKKYILQRLGFGQEQKALEVLCNGHPMGNELNLTFIYRTMWVFTTPDEVLTLTYRLGTHNSW